MQFLSLPAIGLLAAAITFITNWLALNPWRRSQGRHWTERARILYPARATAVSNLWVIPAIITLTAFFWLQDETPNWALVLMFSAAGALLGTLPFDREVFPRIHPRALLRLAAIGWVTRFLMWFLFIGAAAIMPDEFNLTSMLIGAGVIALLILWATKGMFWTSLKIGSLCPAPERLQEIVRATAARMNVSCDRVFLIRSPLAQAYAFPGHRCLLFTERLLEILSDDEIAAVTAHELGHLAEPRSQWLRRYIVWFTFLPWIFIKPAVFSPGGLGILAISGTSVAASFAFRRIAHARELQADNAAHTNELNTGVYASALVKLYADNLMPAVNPKKRMTHPSLYDRLVAAGATPEFPRPAAPSAITIYGILLAIVLCLLFVNLLNHLKGH